MSFIASWIWWSFKVVKWKIWAFSNININDSYELYSKAVNIGLIWPRGNIFNKTEYWAKGDLAKWENLDQKVKDIFSNKN